MNLELCNAINSYRAGLTTSLFSRMNLSHNFFPDLKDTLFLQITLNS